MTHFNLTSEAVDSARWRETLRHPGSGGFCAFEGWVRDSNEGRAVAGLTYEAYAELAQDEGERIVGEAIALYGVIAAQCVHRTGVLKVGDLAVWIGVSAAHRDMAFRACRYIIDEIKRRLPVWKKEHYLDGATAWVACAHGDQLDEHETIAAPGDHRHVHQQKRLPQENDPCSRITQPAVAFIPDYSRQTCLRAVGATGQAKLAAARVLVLGAGGLGCPVLCYLAGAGVGVLGIVDADRLDASNLHRQVMYDARDIGQRKVDLAARRIAALNPTVVVQTFDEHLHAGNIADVFAGYDLVVECTDDMQSRYLSNDAAIVAGTPLILASVYQYEGQLQVVAAQPGAPCLRCLWPQPPSPEHAGSCQEVGVLGSVPGVLGAMQATEALKWLLGLPIPLDHALLLVNLSDGTTQRLPIEVARGCDLHGGCLAVARHALLHAQAERGADLVFIDLADAVTAGYTVVDIRVAAEIASLPLSAPSLRMPSTGIVERFNGIPHGRILLVCATGRRSSHVARTLRGQGMQDVHSLLGGVAALRPAQKDPES